MKPFTPEITRLPRRTVLTVTTIGDPNDAGDAINALYGTAYTTKFKAFKPKGRTMEIGCLSAFWPDAHLKPKSKWKGIWNLEVPSFVRQKDLMQKDSKLTVKLGTLKAGTYAQLLHVGPYSREKTSVEKLHTFIEASRLMLAGPHEEVYLSKPGPKAKTMIRYLVKARRSA